MDPVKVQAIRDWIQPTSVKSLQKFLCFANFYRRFIANFSSVVKPLTDLTKKGTDVTNWSSAAVSAFQELKRRFTSAPGLRQPDVSLPFQVEVDASEIGAGAVLSQRNSDGSLMKPCAFFSRKVSPAERNYDVGNRELLAMKWAFEEWRHWLEGAKHRTVVLTDHKNLIYLESAKRLNPRQARWSLFFSRFDFVVSYLPGQVEPSDCPGVDSVVDRLQRIWAHVVDNLVLSQEEAQRFANRRRRKLQYLVKWKGYGQEDNSWVVASDVHADDLVHAFHLARPDRPGGSGIAYVPDKAINFTKCDPAQDQCPTHSFCEESKYGYYCKCGQYFYNEKDKTNIVYPGGECLGVCDTNGNISICACRKDGFVAQLNDKGLYACTGAMIKDVTDRIPKLFSSKDIHPFLLIHVGTNDTARKDLPTICKDFEELGKKVKELDAQDWRIANVVPIFKKGSKSEPGNYRPINAGMTPIVLLEPLVIHKPATAMIFAHNQLP
ncbi:unnamed protein product, partial [Ranitomeya imitator]